MPEYNFKVIFRELELKNVSPNLIDQLKSFQENFDFSFEKLLEVFFSYHIEHLIRDTSDRIDNKDIGDYLAQEYKKAGLHKLPLSYLNLQLIIKKYGQDLRKITISYDEEAICNQFTMKCRF